MAIDVSMHDGVAVKRCPSCKTLKPRALFSNHKNRADGLQAVCKACELVYRRATQRRSDLLRNYGITPEQFDAMLADQGGGCAICGNSAYLMVDHDHACCPPVHGRKVARACGQCTRGILCVGCNTQLGVRHEDPALLSAEAAAYLARYALVGAGAAS